MINFIVCEFHLNKNTYKMGGGPLFIKTGIGLYKAHQSDNKSNPDL